MTVKLISKCMKLEWSVDECAKKENGDEEETRREHLKNKIENIKWKYIYLKTGIQKSPNGWVGAPERVL